MDTQKPTMTLSAAVIDGNLIEFKVGTVDLGSGVDVSSLIVCELDTDGNCLSNLAGVAEMQGIVTIILTTAMNNPNTQIFASVSDLSGNKTEIRRNVAWFLTTPTDLIFANSFE
jgi:hypothetical protein